MKHLKTKIVCTIGPAVDTYEKLLELAKSGMNVARLNFSHGTHESHLESINNLKKVRKELGIPLTIMLDTKGPEIRIGELKNGFIEVQAGDEITLTTKPHHDSPKHLPINPPSIISDIKAGSTVLIDDGYIVGKVLRVDDDSAVIEIKNNGTIKSEKSVNLPGTVLSLPNPTENDIDDITFGCEHDIDAIAVSFVSSAQDIINIRKLLCKLGRPETQIISKIECSLAIRNFDTILQVTDGIMVARGDLGVELPLSQVPLLQKMMIRRCSLACKPSITATQMLETMIQYPRPTRAEASDVANAIYDCTSMVMLSGETASGKYPIEAVQMMASIASATEKDCNYRERFRLLSKEQFHDTPSAVAMAAVETAYSTNAKAIFVRTNSGRTARIISRLRPDIPIIAITPHLKVYNQLAMNWGVIPVLGELNSSTEDGYEQLSEYALKHKLIHYGDLVIITSDAPFGVTGTTSMMIVKSVGDVLVRGQAGYGQRTHGKIAILYSCDLLDEEDISNHLLIMPQCSEEYLPLIKKASGIILENHIEDVESEKYALMLAKALDIPTIVRANMASNILQQDQMVTIDPKQKLVFNGIVED